MKRKVRIYGDEALRRKAQRVEKVDGAIRSLADDLLETMYASNGLGLAAEQIGRTEAVCVIDIPPGADGDGEETEKSASGVAMPLVLVNPEITESSGEEVRDEGCLSFPDLYVPIRRAARVKVKYLSLENRKATIEAGGLLARALQHELDHLNGVLLIDRLSPVRKIGVAGKLKRLRKKSQDAA